ncbi:hypothetical protein MLD38_013866 [Melastoma candidum]|uniref:Uncharacterized protein n=1 Tax=Melastoma candidum TaxID=119954 RepID=A0ACB9RJE9_9MYRT|nr:hypothetical protein MLD38_013866 [Melastoma candidum]
MLTLVWGREGRKRKGKGKVKELLVLLLLMHHPLTPPVGRDPGAFDVGLALKLLAITAGPAPHVPAVLLCLVPTVLTPAPRARTPMSFSSRSHHHPPPPPPPPNSHFYSSLGNTITMIDKKGGGEWGKNLGGFRELE